MCFYHTVLSLYTLCLMTISLLPSCLRTPIPVSCSSFSLFTSIVSSFQHSLVQSSYPSVHFQPALRGFPSSLPCPSRFLCTQMSKCSSKATPSVLSLSPSTLPLQPLAIFVSNELYLSFPQCLQFIQIPDILDHTI